MGTGFLFCCRRRLGPAMGGREGLAHTLERNEPQASEGDCYSGRTASRMKILPWPVSWLSGGDPARSTMAKTTDRPFMLGVTPSAKSPPLALLPLLHRHPHLQWP